jgi:membrane protein
MSAARHRWQVLWAAVGLAREHQITRLAQAIAFNAFLTIPSAMLAALGVFTLVSQPQDVSHTVERLSGIVPDTVIQLMNSSIQRVAASQSQSLALALVGGAIAVWSMIGAMSSVMWAINIAYDREETRGFLRSKLTALAMAVCAVVAFALVVVGVVLEPVISSWLDDHLGRPPGLDWLWLAAEWAVLVLGLLVTFEAILYLGPSGERPPLRLVTMGSVVAIVIWLAASIGFAFYTANLGSYNKAWGSLAGVIITLTWLWLTSLALVLGAEVNAAIGRSREEGAG